MIPHARPKIHLKCTRDSGRKSRDNSQVKWIGHVLLICVVIGAIVYAIIAHYSFDWSPYTDIQEKVSITGRIVAEPDIRLAKTILEVEIETITGSGEATFEHLIGTTARVQTFLYPEYTIGDQLHITGKIQSPTNFENERGLEFDYVSFLRKDNIFVVMYYPSVERVAGADGMVVRRALFKLKQSWIDHINKVFPEPHAGLINGLLLGVKQALGADLLDQFRVVGLIHIVVLSGFNLTIIARFIEASLTMLSFRLRLIISAILIILFAILVGGGATVVRATIMALISLAALSTHQVYSVSRALWLAGACMIFHNPYILFDDPSFQLSFLATLGLIHMSAPIEKRLQFISEKAGLREIVTATITAQIAVLPLLVFMTGEVSLISIVANMAVLPFVPWVMLLSFIAMLVSYIAMPVALVIGWVCYLITGYIFFIVDFLSTVPFAVVGM